MRLGCERPAVLLALVLPCLVVWAWRQRRTEAVLPLVLRVLTLIAVVIALSGPLGWVAAAPPLRVFLLDTSESVGEISERVVARLLDDVPADEDVLVERFSDATSDDALAAALKALALRIEVGRSARIVVVSDGRWRASDPLIVAKHLRARGVPVDSVVVGLDSPTPVIEEVTFPSRAREGDGVRLSLGVGGIARPEDLRVRVTERPGLKVTNVPWPGRATNATVALEVPAEGTTRWSVDLTDRGTVVSHRDVALDAVVAPKVFLVGVSERDAQTFEAVSVSKPERSERLPPNLDAFDVLVLDGRRPPNEEECLRLRKAVLAGLGVLVLGARGFEAPSAFDALLPVRLLQQTPRRERPVSLVLILDSSGSMEGARMDLAKQVARLATEELTSGDRVGLVEFHGARRWAHPLKPLASRAELDRAIARLSAGGGTIILPALQEARQALRDAPPSAKHIVVMTDGGVERADYGELVARLAADGITLSTVLVGPSTHRDFLARLARQGGGRAYHVPDRFHVPALGLRDPEGAGSDSATADAVKLSAGPDAGALSTLPWDRLPTVARPREGRVQETASVRLLSGDRPAFVSWRRGLGAVSLWLSDVRFDRGDGAPFGRLLRSLIHDVTRPLDDDVALVLNVRGDHLSGWARGGDTVLVNTEEGTARHSLALRGSAPVGTFDLRDLNDGIVRVALLEGEQTRATAAAHVGPLPEWSRWSPDETAMAALAKAGRGRLDGPMSPLRQGAAKPQSLTGAFVLLAIVLFLLQVFLRRWMVPRLASMLALLLLALSAGLLGQEIDVVARVNALASSGYPIPAVRALALEFERADGSLQTFRAELNRRAALRDTPSLMRAILQLDLLDGDLEAAVARALTSERLVGEDVARCAAFVGHDGRKLLEQALSAAAPTERVFLKRTLMALDLDEGNTRSALLRAQDILRGGDDADATLAELALFSAPSWGKAFVSRATRSTTLLLLGLAFERSGDDEEAVNCYRRVFATSDVDARDRRYALAREAGCRRRLGTLDVLLREVRGSTDPVTRPLAVALLLERGEPDDALSLLLSSSGVSQESAVPIALAGGRPEVAIASLKAAYARDPSVRESLARLLVLEDRVAEARRLYDEGVASEDPNVLLETARAARSVGLRSVAFLALDRAKERGASLDAALLEAEMRAAIEGVDAARAVIAPWLDAATVRRRTLEVSARLERLGLIDLATDVLRQDFQETADADVGLRWAGLLRDGGFVRDALTVLRTLFAQPLSATRRWQVQSELLDLAASTGTLADLVVDAELALEKGVARATDLSFVIEAYLRVGDATAAALAAEEYGGALKSDEVERLKMLVTVFRRAGAAASAEETLQRLFVVDPTHARSYGEERCLNALERGDGPATVAAVDDHLARFQDDAALAFAAGIFDEIGLSDRAARVLRRLEAREPDPEARLREARALARSGAKERAEGRLITLFLEDDPVLWASAVDGLIDLEAAPVALRAARRRLISGVAQGTEAPLLCAVLSDLAEEMGDEGERDFWLDVKAVFSPLERDVLFVERIEGALAREDFAEAISNGRLVLALGNTLRPESALRLARQLLSVGDVTGAKRLIAQVDGALEDSASRRQSAVLLLSAGEVSEALSRLTALARLNPEDLPLLGDLARAREYSGDAKGASQAYFSLLKSLLLRLPVHSDPGLRRLSSAPPAGEEVDQRGALAGILATTENPEPVFDWLSDALRRDLLEVRGDLSENPRVKETHRTLRHLALAYGRTELALATDQQVFAGFLGDAADREAAVRVRSEEFRIMGAAVEAAHALGVPMEAVPDVAVRALLDGDRPTDRTSSVVLIRAALASVILGEAERGARFLGDALAHDTSLPLAAARSAVLASWLLEDDALTRAAISRWAMSAASIAQSQVATSRVREVLAVALSFDTAFAAELREQLRRSLPLRPAWQRAALETALTEARMRPPVRLETVLTAERAEHGAQLRALSVEEFGATHARDYLLTYPPPYDETLAAVLAERLASSRPSPEVFGDLAFALDSEVAAAVLSRVAARLPDDPLVVSAEAIALARCGDAVATIAAVRRVLDRSDVLPPLLLQLPVVAEDDLRRRLIDALSNEVSVPALAMRSRLYLHDGEVAKATDDLLSAVAERSEDRGLLVSAVELLWSQGRFHDAERLLIQRTTRDATVWQEDAPLWIRGAWERGRLDVALRIACVGSKSERLLWGAAIAERTGHDGVAVQCWRRWAAAQRELPTEEVWPSLDREQRTESAFVRAASRPGGVALLKGVVRAAGQRLGYGLDPLRRAVAAHDTFVVPSVGDDVSPDGVAMRLANVASLDRRSLYEVLLAWVTADDPEAVAELSSAFVAIGDVETAKRLLLTTLIAETRLAGPGALVEGQRIRELLAIVPDEERPAILKRLGISTVWMPPAGPEDLARRRLTDATPETLGIVVDESLGLLRKRQLAPDPMRWLPLAMAPTDAEVLAQRLVAGISTALRSRRERAKATLSIAQWLGRQGKPKEAYALVRDVDVASDQLLEHALALSHLADDAEAREVGIALLKRFLERGRLSSQTTYDLLAMVEASEGGAAAEDLARPLASSCRIEAVLERAVSGALRVNALEEAEKTLLSLSALWPKNGRIAELRRELSQRRASNNGR